jgi:hypothetical protein
MPIMHVFAPAKVKDVDGRNKSGHDENKKCGAALAVGALDPGFPT